uniref:Uncharacterized protein n=1 Tax=Sphaerodactylus townsendi TaxID=933632 RepID=A0ACB8GBT3_9SAUR
MIPELLETELAHRITILQLFTMANIKSPQQRAPGRVISPDLYKDPAGFLNVGITLYFAILDIPLMASSDHQDEIKIMILRIARWQGLAGAENVQAIDDVGRKMGRTEDSRQADTGVCVFDKQKPNIRYAGLNSRKSMEMVLYGQSVEDILVDYYGYLWHDDMGKDDNIVIAPVELFGHLQAKMMLLVHH